MRAFLLVVALVLASVSGVRVAVSNPEECTIFENWRKALAGPHSEYRRVGNPPELKWVGVETTIALQSGSGSIAYAGVVHDWEECLAACQRTVACKQVVFCKTDNTCRGMNKLTNTEEDRGYHVMRNDKGGKNNDYVSAQCNSDLEGRDPKFGLSKGYGMADRIGASVKGLYKCETLRTYDDNFASISCAGHEVQYACFSLEPNTYWQCFDDQAAADAAQCHTTHTPDGSLYDGACVYAMDYRYEGAKDGSIHATRTTTTTTTTTITVMASTTKHSIKDALKNSADAYSLAVMPLSLGLAVVLFGLM